MIIWLHRMNRGNRHIVVLIMMQIVCLQQVIAQGPVTILDASHYSNVFGESRSYRVFLPPSYATNKEKRFPVIYFLHGWSQRYFGSSNPYGDFDKDDQNGGDNIAAFVTDHDVIVVKPDGYNRSPHEKYYVRPYNVSPVETYRQFPIYFPELVAHIDAQYRTLPDREHRGIAGLSMGGFMTFWIGGKYPHLVSAAGNFCGSPEFVVGPKDFPAEYRHLDMYRNYGGMNLRLHYGDKDFIRGYHEDLNRVWPQLIDNYDFKIFDAAHSTCGLGEMLAFILETFENPPPIPSPWHHTDVYPAFSVWGYEVMTDRTAPGFTVLENVDERGFRSAVRNFLPDGELLPSVKMIIRTPAIYERDQVYTINDFNTGTSHFRQTSVRSDDDGRLVIELDGGSHEIGINEENDGPNLAIASVNLDGKRWATAGEETTVTIELVNKGRSEASNVRATLSATRPSARITKGNISIPTIPENKTARLSMTFVSMIDTIAVERLQLTLRDDKNHEWKGYFEVPLQRKLQEITDFEIADGRTLIVAASGNSTDTVTLGRGNGDGMANPGESIVVVVRDSAKLWRADLTGKDPHINPYGVNVRKSDNWTSFDHVGGSAKYDVPLISSACPQNHRVEFAAEYWLPQYPHHIIRRGVVRFDIKGKDATSPAIEDIQLSSDNTLSAKLYDGGDISSVHATLTDEKDPGKTIRLQLTDDGRNGDRAAGDRVFSKRVPSQVFGIFKITIHAEDSYGNRSHLEPDRTFVAH